MVTCECYYMLQTIQRLLALSRRVNGIAWAHRRTCISLKRYEAPDAVSWHHTSPYKPYLASLINKLLQVYQVFKCPCTFRTHEHLSALWSQVPKCPWIASSGWKSNSSLSALGVPFKCPSALPVWVSKCSFSIFQVPRHNHSEGFQKPFFNILKWNDKIQSYLFIKIVAFQSRRIALLLQL